MSKLADENLEEEIVPGASGCLIALVVIAMFGCYGLGIVTGGYGQRYLDRRQEQKNEQAVFPDPDAPPGNAAPQQGPEQLLAQAVEVQQGGAKVTLELATVRFSRGGGSGEVKLTGLLLMRLRVKNVSADRPLELTSWMHADVRTWLAQLVDNQNVAYEPIHDADPRVGLYLMSLPQYRPAQRIAPGEEAVTWVAFSIATRPVAALRLSLSAVNYGSEGLIFFDIPAGAVTEGNPID